MIALRFSLIALIISNHVMFIDLISLIHCFYSIISVHVDSFALFLFVYISSTIFSLPGIRGLHTISVVNLLYRSGYTSTFNSWTSINICLLKYIFGEGSIKNSRVEITSNCMLWGFYTIFFALACFCTLGELFLTFLTTLFGKGPLMRVQYPKFESDNIIKWIWLKMMYIS